MDGNSVSKKREGAGMDAGERDGGIVSRERGREEEGGGKVVRVGEKR